MVRHHKSHPVGHLSALAGEKVIKSRHHPAAFISISAGPVHRDVALAIGKQQLKGLGQLCREVGCWPKMHDAIALKLGDIPQKQVDGMAVKVSKS